MICACSLGNPWLAARNGRQLWPQLSASAILPGLRRQIRHARSGKHGPQEDTREKGEIVGAARTGEAGSAMMRRTDTSCLARRSCGLRGSDFATRPVSLSGAAGIRAAPRRGGMVRRRLRTVGTNASRARPATSSPTEGFDHRSSGHANVSEPATPEPVQRGKDAAGPSDESRQEQGRGSATANLRRDAGRDGRLPESNGRRIMGCNPVLLFTPPGPGLRSSPGSRPTGCCAGMP